MQKPLLGTSRRFTILHTFHGSVDRKEKKKMKIIPNVKSHDAFTMKLSGIFIFEKERLRT